MPTSATSPPPSARSRPASRAPTTRKARRRSWRSASRNSSAPDFGFRLWLFRGRRRKGRAYRLVAVEAAGLHLARPRIQPPDDIPVRVGRYLISLGLDAASRQRQREAQQSRFHHFGLRPRVSFRWYL